MIHLTKAEPTNNAINVSDIASASLLTSMLTADSETEPYECQCGKIKGFRNIGVVCDTCQTKVDTAIKSQLIIQAPANRKFIIPHIYNMIELSISKHPFLGVFMGTVRIKSVPKSIANLVLATRELLQWEPGLNWLVENLIDTLKAMAIVSTETAANNLNDILSLIEYKDMVTDELRMPSKALNTINGKRRLSYVAAIEAAIEARKMRDNEARAANVQVAISEYARLEQAESHSGKTGTRKTIGSFVLNHTLRFTIIPECSVKTQVDEIFIPYKGAVTVFDSIIMGVLLDRSMSHLEASETINNSVNDFNKDIYDIMMTFLKDNRRGVVASFSRNPAQGFGSIPTSVIAHINEDPNDETIHIHGNSVGPMNADFDGDQLHIKIHIDDKSAVDYESLRLYNSMSMTLEPYGVNGKTACVMGSIPTGTEYLKHRKG